MKPEITALEWRLLAGTDKDKYEIQHQYESQEDYNYLACIDCSERQYDRIIRDNAERNERHKIQVCIVYRLKQSDFRVSVPNSCSLSELIPKQSVLSILETEAKICPELAGICGHLAAKVRGL